MNQNPNLRPILFDEAGKLSVDTKTNDLYWDNQKIQTKITLDNTERGLAWTVTISTVVSAGAAAISAWPVIRELLK